MFIRSGKICPACKKLVLFLGLKSVSESISISYLVGSYETFLSWLSLYNLFQRFNKILQAFKFNTIYLNTNTFICINLLCPVIFFAKFVILLFFLQPYPVFLMSTSIMRRVEFQFQKILFFWARFRTSHEGFGKILLI